MLYTITITPFGVASATPVILQVKGLISAELLLFRIDKHAIQSTYGNTTKQIDDNDPDLWHVFTKNNKTHILDISLEKTPNSDDFAFA